ncbi:MAG: hypothetical protein S4CHLAM6_01160 [Chlamydiae bacterium]|nr:hypothetical protein [Chlamydiota bacterium]
MSEKASGLIYVSCAFGEEDQSIRELRIELVSRFCAQKMREGVIVFSPLIHNYHILKYGLPIGWDYWEKFNKKLLERCDRLYVLKLKGWEKSIGIQAEIAIARSLDIPIEYQEPGALENETISLTKKS